MPRRRNPRLPTDSAGWTAEQAATFVAEHRKAVALIVATPTLDVLERDWRADLDGTVCALPEQAAPTVRRLLSRVHLVVEQELRCAYCFMSTHAAAAEARDPAAGDDAPLTFVPVCRAHAHLWTILSGGPQYTERHRP